MRRVRLAWVVLSCVTYGLVRCGGESTGGDGGGPDVTTMDSPSPGPDASNDVAQQQDTGGNDTGTGSDASDAGTDSSDGGGSNINQWTCGTAVVTDCSLCIGHTQACVYCDNMDASVLSGICVEQGTGCGNTIPMGYNLCACPKDAGACPEPYQVCLPITMMNSVCDTCGAVTTTNGLTCENGGKCDAVDGGCL